MNRRANPARRMLKKVLTDLRPIDTLRLAKRDALALETARVRIGHFLGLKVY